MGTRRSERNTGNGSEVIQARARAPQTNRVRKLILDIALDLFSRYGFNGTSIRMIAEESEFSHSLVSYHFDSKEKLWIAVMDDVIGKFADRVRAIVAQQDGLSAASRLEAFIEEVVKIFSEKPQIHHIFIQQSTQKSGRLDWLVNNYVRDHFAAVTNLIHEAQVEGAIRHGDPARIYYFIISTAGTPFAVEREYSMLTGRDIFSATEVYHISSTICDFLFGRDRVGGSGGLHMMRGKPGRKKALRE